MITGVRACFIAEFGVILLVEVVRADRGPVSPMEKPNESAPQATMSVNKTERLRTTEVKGTSSALPEFADAISAESLSSSSVRSRS
jgi:hypothetical protein